MNDAQQRLSRIEQQSGGVPSEQDAKRQAQYDFAKQFAEQHPALHSGPPRRRAVFEKDVARVLAQELALRMDQTNLPMAQALRGLNAFYLRQAAIDDAQAEDWGDDA